MLEHLSNVFSELPYILRGVGTTIGVVLCSLGLGFMIGVPLAIVQVYGRRPITWIVGVYVWFFRGTPVLVLLYLFYLGLFTALGLNISPFTSSCIVLGLTSAAYQSQIFRGSIESLPSGQLKAARALGISDAASIKSIILPQALRLALPGWSNEYSILLKDSALVSTVGVMEIMKRSEQVASRTFSHLTYFILAGVLFFIITVVGLKLLRALEKKFRLPGYNI